MLKKAYGEAQTILWLFSTLNTLEFKLSLPFHTQRLWSALQPLDWFPQLPCKQDTSWSWTKTLMDFKGYRSGWNWTRTRCGRFNSDLRFSTILFRRESHVAFDIVKTIFDAIHYSSLLPTSPSITIVRIFPVPLVYLNLSLNMVGIKSNDAGNSGVHGFDNGVNSAILRYKGAPEAEPTKNQTDIYQNMLLETSLHVRLKSQHS